MFVRDYVNLQEQEELDNQTFFLNTDTLGRCTLKSIEVLRSGGLWAIIEESDRKFYVQPWTKLNKV